MKTTDFTASITSAKLNENMFKKFGTKVNLNKYTREELENYRNLLRTKVNQQESSAGFNDLLANEGYQKDKFMLNLLNTRINEMLGENKKLSEKAVSKSQQQAAGVALAAKKAGKKPAGKGASAEMAKMPKKDLEKFAKTKHKDLPKKVKEEMKPGDTKKSSTGGTVVKTKTGVIHKAGKNYSGKSNEKKTEAKKVKEASMRDHYRMILEGLNQFLTEDEEGKAKDITAGTDMVHDFTSWMQRVGQYQTKSMIELSDSIRANFGQAESDAFKNSIQPALQEALAALTQSRETITRAVAVLAGEESVQEPMGMAAPLPDADFNGTPDLDTMNVPPEDEFAAADAAAGGAETAGRAMRESRELRRARLIAEQHSIISRLAPK